MIRSFLGLSLILTLSLALQSPALAARKTVSNCIREVNIARGKYGAYAFRERADLQKEAMREAMISARSGRGGHVSARASGTPGSCWPGNAEGVGWGTSNDVFGYHFHTCFHVVGSRRPWLDRSHRFAGAACAVAADGTTYYCLILG